MEKKSKNSDIDRHDSSVEPIITQIDILRNPVFSITDFGKELDEAQSLDVNGLPQIEIKNRQLSAAAADVFHILIHLGKKENFDFGKDNVFYFTSRQILDFMGWDQNGRNYKRFDKCLEELTDVRIKFIQPLAGQTVSGYLQFFHSKILFHPNGSEQDILFKSQISFTPFLLNLCKKGRLKPIHPVYYELRSRLSKRLLELLSAYASDLKQWEVDVMWLRDIIPMKGKKYEYASNVKDNLSRALKDLHDRQIVTSYNFYKKDRKWFVVIHANRTYLFSKSFPSPTRKNLKSFRKERVDSKTKNTPLFRELVKRKVSEETAARLLATYKKDNVLYQIDHCDYLWELAKKGTISPDKAPQAGGWFVSALKDSYQAPEGFKTRVERKKENKRKVLINEAQAMIDQGNYRRALEKIEICLSLKKDAEVLKIFDLVTEKIRLEEENIAVENYLKTLSPEMLESIRIEAEKRLEQELPKSLYNMALSSGISSPIYKTYYQIVANERYQENKNQVILSL